MKKIVFAAFILGLGLSFLAPEAAHAFKEESVSRFAAKKTYGKKLRSAIQQRWNRDFKEVFIRDRAYKTRKAQIDRHQVSRAEGNVNERSTNPVRSGELTNYEGRRSVNNGYYDAVNNSKRNFRRRAIDYYVDDGYADKEILKVGIRSSEHRVKRIPDSYYNKGLFDSDIKDRIRETQKALKSPDQVGAGQQRQRSLRKGSFYRGFYHPFIRASLFE